MIINLFKFSLLILLILLIHDHLSQKDGSAYGIVPKFLYFDKNVNLSMNTGSSQNPQIAAVDKNVYVVWEDDVNGNKEIYFTHSLDNGSTFGLIDNLSSNNGTSQNPQIAAVNKNVYVVWEDNDTNTNNIILLRPSVNDGSSFKSTRYLTKNLTGSGDSPQILAIGKNVYVVWEYNETKENKEIYFKTSPNNGSGFRGSKNLSNNNGTSQNPQIAAVDKNVYVVWEDNDAKDNKEIFLKASTNQGTTFKNTKNISDTIGISEAPQIKLSDTEIYIIWQDSHSTVSKNAKTSDSGDQNRTFFKYGNTEKLNFGTAHKLLSIGNILSPKLVAGEDTFFGTWSVELANNRSTLEFYPFGLFEDYPGTGIRIASLGTYISNPVLATSGKNVFIVWQNKIYDNDEIFFKKISTESLDGYSR